MRSFPRTIRNSLAPTKIYLSGTSPLNLLLQRNSLHYCRRNGHAITSANYVHKSLNSFLLGGRSFSSLGYDDATIYALSTAPGRSALAIVRCSGPACLDIYKALCPDTPVPKPRYATLRTLYEPRKLHEKHQILDAGSIVLYFQAPRTVTGEDVLEFHIHGGPAIIKAVLSAISSSVPTPKASTPLIRYAEPGEFTRRAFYNDRLDLTQIEALGDTLSAETEQQRRLAVQSTSNTLQERYSSWRNLLLEARGELEALIDFSEDQHFDESPKELAASVAVQVFALKRRIQASIENAAKGELLRGGINIALLGAPNAGKSSLLNQIVGRDAAIVSSEAGTTRDVVDINVDIGGFFCKFGDLAGLRAASSSPTDITHLVPDAPLGQVETEGIRRAKARALIADVVIVVLSVEPSVTEGEKRPYEVRLDSEVASLLEQCDPERQGIVFAVNKVDLLGFADESSISESTRHIEFPSRFATTPIFPITCLPDPNNPSAGGIQPLLKGLTEVFVSLTTPTEITDDSRSNESSPPSSWDESLGASERQRLLLSQTQSYLDEFLACVGANTADNDKDKNKSPDTDTATTMEDDEEDEGEMDIVVAAESLRYAADCLGRIRGRGEAGDVEEVLGVVFEKFCVGK